MKIGHIFDMQKKIYFVRQRKKRSIFDKIFLVFIPCEKFVLCALHPYTRDSGTVLSISRSNLNLSKKKKKPYFRLIPRENLIFLLTFLSENLSSFFYFSLLGYAIISKGGAFSDLLTYFYLRIPIFVIKL